MPPKNNNQNNNPRDGKKPAPRGAGKRGKTICRFEDGEWFCYKMDGGQAVQCGGPYETREECEESGCNE